MIALACTAAITSPLVVRYLFRRYYSKTLPCPDRFLNFQELCEKNGFECEKHEVITEDNYILTLFRILPKNVSNGQVVFIQHGLGSSSDSWVCNEPHLCPAFILASRGFEVWVGNSRGNTHSKSHLHLNPAKDKAYWEFSFVEMGRYDLPAAINKALQLSGASGLHYIGTSQGTSMLFVSLVQNPLFWREKVKSCSLLAPVCILNHTSFGRRVAAKLKLTKLIHPVMVGEFPKGQKFLGSSAGFFTEFCPQIVWLGSNRKIDNVKRIPVFASHSPGGASLQCLDHYSQIIRNKRFEYYDYGRVKNLQKYGTEAPPLINLASLEEGVCPPLLIIAGTEDKLASMRDTHWIRDQLQQKKVLKKYVEMKLGHNSFSVGLKMDYLTDHVIPFMLFLSD